MHLRARKHLSGGTLFGEATAAFAFRNWTDDTRPDTDAALEIYVAREASKFPPWDRREFKGRRQPY